MKVTLMIDHDNLEEFRDPEAYDLECEEDDEDRPFVEQWAGSPESPLLDLACGTGRMALRLAAQGYQVTGVDIVPEMIARAREKAAERAVSVEWVVADARRFQLQKQFPLIFMLKNAFQFFLTREDQEAMLVRVREHLQAEGYFIFTVRNFTPDLFEVHLAAAKEYVYAPVDGKQLVITEAQHYDAMTQIRHFSCQYHWLYPDGHEEKKLVRTALRYFFPQEMETLLYYNGFQIRSCYGNWQQAPLTATSPAMIYVCQRRI